MRFQTVVFALIALVIVPVAASISDYNVPFSLRYVPGFFKQGTPSIDVPDTNPEHLGLLDNVTWKDVDVYIKGRAAQGVDVKLLLLLRHGEGIHNVAEAKYGTEAWERYYRKLAKYTDAKLTSLGMGQAQKAAKRVDEELKRGLKIDEVIVSPLERTLHTAMIAYQKHEEIPKRSMEWPRETIGICTCDLRGTISSKAEQYKTIDFSEIWSDADPWWTPDHRETEAHIDDRARMFLNRVFYSHKTTYIGVVSHSGLITAAMRVVGHRKYSVATAEIIPFLLEDTNVHVIPSILSSKYDM
ncbi:putative phosphoglycerate mutase [Phytophthora citrophthora]|uniref:Phosphoglycerate mutase n=1 Tax=Phytophthora citrophthora TaxID=4793 RepID=A0AAD9H2X1_9STRA|nr:putative phosphoglycerate mutase [Phytophthora citrophthora]